MIGEDQMDLLPRDYSCQQAQQRANGEHLERHRVCCTRSPSSQKSASSGLDAGLWVSGAWGQRRALLVVSITDLADANFGHLKSAK